MLSKPVMGWVIVAEAVTLVVFGVLIVHELVGSFGGELLGGSAPLVATADQHPGRATAACPTAVRAGPRAGRWRHWRRLRRHWRR